MRVAAAGRRRAACEREATAAADATAADATAADEWEAAATVTAVALVTVAEWSVHTAPLARPRGCMQDEQGGNTREALELARSI